MTGCIVWRMTRLALASFLIGFGMPGLASAQGASCEPQKAAQKYPAYANKVAKIGVNSTYPPFSYNESNDMKKLAGLDVDIIESVMQCAGLKFEYVNGPHTGLYPALFSGFLDVMLSNIFYKADRADKAGFVLYMVNGQSLVVRKGNPKSIKSPDDMCAHAASGAFDGSSAVIIQDVSKKCIESGKAGITWTPAPDQEPAYRSLANERIDMVMDGAASAAMRINSSEGKAIEVAFTLQTGVKSGFIIPKGNQEMLKIVADGMTDLQASGRLAALMKKHGLQEEWLIPIEVRP